MYVKKLEKSTELIWISEVSLTLVEPAEDSVKPAENVAYFVFEVQELLSLL